MEYLREKFGVGSIAENKVDGRYAFLSSVMHKEETPHCHERVTFNIGGTIFQTCRTTLENPKRHVAKLQDTHYLQQHWDPEHEEYFFDRDPAIFRSVLNYIRRGVLHLPSNMCSPQVTAELVFWGLPRVDIEPCCWKEYNMGVQALKNLRNLERDRKPAYILNRHFDEREYGNAWDRFRAAVWRILSDPSSSKLAKNYSTFMQILVLISLFCFVFKTLQESDIKIVDKKNTDNDTLNDSHFSLNATEDRKEEILVIHYGLSTFIDILQIFEVFCLSFFVLDIMLALVSFPEGGFRDYMTDAGIIDIVAVFPDIVLVIFQFEVAKGTGITYEDVERISLLRLLRLMRTMRVIRRMPIVMTTLYTIVRSLKDVIPLCFVLLFTNLSLSVFMYHIEPRSNINSLFTSLWWGIITITTVGYGDVVPITPGGKVIASICAVFGMVFFGIMVPTIIANFTDYHKLFEFMKMREEVSAVFQETPSIDKQLETFNKEHNRFEFLFTKYNTVVKQSEWPHNKTAPWMRKKVKNRLY